MEKNKKALWLFIITIVFLTIIRLVFIFTLNLSDDEAYYWQFARYLSLSYYEHPPLVAWSNYIMMQFLGSTAYAVRMSALLYSIGDSILVWLIAGKLLKDRMKASFAVIVINIIPAYAIGGLMMLPDAPLGFFWLLTMYFLVKVFMDGKGNYWYAAGTALGFAMLSKYHSIFIPLSALTFMIVSKDDRKWFKDKRTYIAAIIALIIFTPVIVWNIQHNFASVRFELVSRNPNFHLSINKFFTFLGSQVGLVSPFIYFLILYAIYYGFKVWQRDKNKTYLFLSIFSIVIVSFFFAVSFVVDEKPNWALMGYIPAVIIMIQLSYDMYQKKGYRFYLWLALSIALLFTMLIHIQLYYPLIPLKPADTDLTNDLYGWHTAGKAVMKAYDELSKQGKTFIFTHKYQLSSQLAFNAPGQPQVYTSNNTGDSYHDWGMNVTKKLIGWNAVYINDNSFRIDPLQHFKCKKWVELSPINIYRFGHYARTFYVYKCYGFEGIIRP
ncbi:MAG: glycosyltransferase family 39 protein [Deltaproteobacteria bacterium]|nr:glycosyltransferase family 39 protein [Deltaproteobacteria bacterium]MCL5792043.1 glycosyltransferase family 39 protein [Deltaproteobacteria bacterium]